MTDLIRAYFDPESHAVDVPVHLILSDEKVDDGHVARLGGGIKDPSTMRPIVVIRHPRVEAYAVLDGHHRFCLVRNMGLPTIRAAVVDDYVGLGFHLTAKGLFQPTAAFTKFVRVPVKRFVSWMTEFLSDPKGMLARAPEVEDGECGPEE